MDEGGGQTKASYFQGHFVVQLFSRSTVSVGTTSSQMMVSLSVESTGSPSILWGGLTRKSPLASSIVPQMMTHQSHLLLPNAHKRHCLTHSSHYQEDHLLSLERVLFWSTTSQPKQ